ncbi:MAG: hypothetical protein C4520_12510 [Candidatus Abyssobacteria bacterium SURF_5]|uniref:Uncharacterized protein n=1 Tax=Abyssobacteria bacterium (strain SURF_5) TaxID=2093360 RepID=A0A3A4NV45_ABYX5|nr:MAG: hypothetical protein C4520_12510 [Candidatus Abyssubacteria bacterium SURF_5]
MKEFDEVPVLHHVVFDTSSAVTLKSAITSLYTTSNPVCPIHGRPTFVGFKQGTTSNNAGRFRCGIAWAPKATGEKLLRKCIGGGRK